ncbi:MAG TPA: hypothetical protein VG871_06610 [Vicinamibacterales bacterium]|nr:hypothetical protein [Vicinamibacterales bacterium]
MRPFHSTQRWRMPPLGGDQQIGVNIVKRAIEEPLRWIATNAGQEGASVVQRVRDMKDEDGFNALTDTDENLSALGLIVVCAEAVLRDRDRVVRHAVSIESGMAGPLRAGPVVFRSALVQIAIRVGSGTLVQGHLYTLSHGAGCTLCSSRQCESVRS